MSKTLRREIRKIIETILNEYIATGQSYLGKTVPTEVVDKIADAILELRAFKNK